MEREIIVVSQKNARVRVQEHRLVLFIILSLIAFLMAMLFYPLPIAIVWEKYPFYPSYLVWFIAILSVPIAIRVKKYHNLLTAFVWLLRWIMGFEFLIVSLQVQSVELEDIILWIATLAPTFFYELGFLVTVNDKHRMLLKILLLFSLLSILPVSIKASFDLIQSGIQGLLDSVHNLRQLNASWPNYVAIMMAICFLIAREVAAVQHRYRILLIVPLFVLGLTLSRTGIIALLCGLFVTLSKIKRSFWGKIMIIIVFLSVVWIVFINKGMTPGSTLSYTIGFRVERWLQAIRVWADNPLFGTGFRSLTTTIPSYYSISAEKVLDFGSAHSDYIDLLVRGGLIYLAIFLLFVITYLVRCWYKTLHGSESLGRLTLAIPVMILAAAIVQNPLKDPSIGPLFWLFIGMGASYENRILRYLNKQL